MHRIDLNCDMGESFGVYTLGADRDVLQFVTSANIACGFHAGDPLVMDRTVKMAAAHGVGVGAHPGFPDLTGFGRRIMDCSPREIKDYVIYQIGAITAFCGIHGVALQHVKPHGSLYNMAVGNEPVARSLIEALAAVDGNLILVTLAGRHGDLMARIGKDTGIRIAMEAFPDRAYTSEGALVSRRHPGAVVRDPAEAAERAVRMVKERRIIAVDGSSIDIEAHTLCIHGDTPSAVEFSRRIREALETDGVQVLPLARRFSARD